MKLRYFLAALFLPLSISKIQAQLSPAPDFMTHLQPKTAIITDYRQRESIPSDCGLIRLPNGKIACMVRKNGKMSPFYIKSIETGYWDTRYDKTTNYVEVFKDMRSLGANTASVMIHWEEIETSDNNFDYTFADNVVKAAEKADIKINWVLFLHTQKNGVPSHGAENAWTFHLDDRDSSNYTMQWPMKNGEILSNVRSLLEKGGIRPLHLYGHPAIFKRIRRMLYNLAVHYRNSKTVIGIQLGNEEGFSFLDESDYNPVTEKLYQEWKLKTNKTDYAQFKKEAFNWWWKQFTTAYHEGDPYKIVSFNLDAAQAEGGDLNRIDMTGTSASTYADGNIDVIGTMLYKNWGYKALKGLDKRYNEGNYIYSLPIFIPSEIGIGNFNSDNDFNRFVIHSIERGAQGIGIYCYGEVWNRPKQKANRYVLRNMLRSIRENQDIIYEGMPGPGYASCRTEAVHWQVSHLNACNGATLAMVYQPQQTSERQESSLPLSFKVSKSGRYHLKVYKNGELMLQQQFNLISQDEKEIILTGTNLSDYFFIRITADTPA